MFFELLPGLGHEARRVAGLYAAAMTAAVIAITAADAAVPSIPDRARLAAAPTTLPAVLTASATPALPAYAIAFESPVKGEGIDSPFGLRRLPWEAHGRLHAGIDIAAASGAPVHAAAEGVVARAGKSPSHGHFVEIAHAGGLKSLYAHMGSQTSGLRRGARLEKGRVIGFVGSTGRSTGAHLHFEIRKANRPLDPERFIGRSFARLGDLPIAQAARFPRRVRVAYVSRWPDSVLRARAEKAAEAKAPETKPELIRVASVKKPASEASSTPIEGVKVTPIEGGRVSATVTLGG